MTRMYYTSGVMRGRSDLRLNVETNPYEVQDYLASLRRSKSAMIVKGANTSRWSSLPQRPKAVTAREPKKVPTLFKSCNCNDEDREAVTISLDVVRSPLSARTHPSQTNSADLESQSAACLTKYFPYRRSGYLDHIIRQSRVNSARVLMCDNPDVLSGMMPSQRIKSAQPVVVAANKVAIPARAKTAEPVREPPLQTPRRRHEMKLRTVEIKDSGLGVKTKEYTTDTRNVNYTRRTQKEVPTKEMVKAVRFEGGFQEAVVSPRRQEVFDEEPEPEEEEPLPQKPEVKLRNDIIMEHQPAMDTSVSKESNHIPFNIYRVQNRQPTQPIVSRKSKNIDDYDYKTDKVLSYYLQQERRPGTAQFNFKAQSKLHVATNQGNKSTRGRVRSKSHINEGQGQSELAQPNLGGFLKIHKPLVLHQRSVEEDQGSRDNDHISHDQPEDTPGVFEQKSQKPSHPFSNNTPRPPIDQTNLCLLCNCSNTDNWKLVDAMLSQSSAQDLTLPALNKSMKH